MVNLVSEKNGNGPYERNKPWVTFGIKLKSSTSAIA